jgi:hypothetical protein
VVNGDAISPHHDPPVSAALMRALAAHPEQMADLVAALGAPVNDADSLVELFSQVCAQAVTVIDGAQWAGVTAQLRGRPFTAARTDDVVVALDERQYSIQDGPCLQAMRTDAVVVMTVEQAAERWPELVDAARRVGVRSFLAAPIHLYRRSVGCLNLYGNGDQPRYDKEAFTVLTEYLDRAVAGYTHHQGGGAESAETGLRQAVATRRRLQLAIGILMTIHRCGVGRARELLGEQARAQGLSTGDRAATIVIEHTSDEA